MDVLSRIPFLPSGLFCSRQNRGPSDFDLKYSAALNFSCPLPAVTSGALMHVAGGWELDGILQAQTGSPFSPLVGFESPSLPVPQSALSWLRLVAPVPR